MAMWKSHFGAFAAIMIVLGIGAMVPDWLSSPG